MTMESPKSFNGNKVREEFWALRDAYAHLPEHRVQSLIDSWAEQYLEPFVESERHHCYIVQQRIEDDSTNRSKPRPIAARREEARVWLQAMSDLANTYVALRWLGARPPAPDAINRLAGLAERLAKGATPSFVADALSGKGRPKRLPRERYALACALWFLEAVAAGDIRERAPVKLVAKTYGVTPRAVQKWREQHDEIVHGLKRPQTSELTEAMKRQGAHYLRVGRGAGGEPD